MRFRAASPPMATFYICCHGNKAVADGVLQEIKDDGGDGAVLAFDIGNATATEKALAPVVGGPREVTAVIHGAGVGAAVFVCSGHELHLGVRNCHEPEWLFLIWCGRCCGK